MNELASFILDLLPLFTWLLLRMVCSLCMLARELHANIFMKNVAIAIAITCIYECR